MKIINNNLLTMVCGLAIFFQSLVAQAMETNVLTGGAQPQINASTKPATYGRLIVKLKEGVARANTIAAKSTVVTQASRYAGQQVHHVRTIATGAHAMRLQNKVSRAELERIIVEMSADPSVAYVEEDRMMRAMFTPNDPRYDDQWHYYDSNGGMNMPEAWDSSTGEGVVVAVLDTGITAHEDLRANTLAGYDMISELSVANDGDLRDDDATDPGDWNSFSDCDFPASDSSWHGTHVAGTIAAVTNNNLGGAGVAFDAKILPVRVLGRCGGLSSDIVDAIVWSSGGSVSGVPDNANPAQVINMSLGGGGACGQAFQAAINTATENGATVVAAAGNSAENVSNASPANCNNVIAVAAVGRSGGRASYSNFGNLVDIAAPGGDQSSGGTSAGVLSTLNSGRTTPAGDNYVYYQGTSMAAPHAAGAVALLYAVKPDLTPAEAEQILKDTARNFANSCSGCGAGLIDAAAAVAAAGGVSNPDPEPVDTVLQNGIPISNLSDNEGGTKRFTIDLPEGAINFSVSLSGGSGDPDLYLRFATAPNRENYDCRSWESGTSENCSVANPQNGTYHVLVDAYKSYSNLTLLAKFDELVIPDPNPSDGVLENGVPVTNLADEEGGQERFIINVPEGATNLSVSLNGGSGDADLYLRFTTVPSRENYDCRSWETGNSESCRVENPKAGTYHVLVDAYKAYSKATLLVEFDEIVIPDPDPDDGGLQNGIPVRNLADDEGGAKRFIINVPAGAFNLSVSLRGGSGDADLYLRRATPPTRDSYDCRSWDLGSSEDCDVRNPQNDTYHVLIDAYRSYSNVTLLVEYDG